MTFERKIAGQALAEVKAPSIAPTGDQKGATQTISGGALSAKDRGHKNWGQTINQGFELRSLMGTAMFKNLDMAPGTFELDLGAFGYHTVRSSGPTLAVSLAKPDGVPSSQHTVGTPPKFRHRQRWGFLEVFYPEATTLSFSADFAYGVAAWRAQFWEQEDLALLVGSDEPITYAQLTKDVVPQTLDLLLAEAPRAANTSDLFMVSYNERTGKATVVLLSGGMVGMDPDVPVPDTTEPVPGDGVPTPTPKPWEKPTPRPGTPNPDTEHDYTDPTTGLPLVASPPPAGAGTLYALHGASVSVSADGGATWGGVNISGAGALVDLVATPAGLFVLDDTGQVFTAPTIADAFQLVALSQTSTDEVEIPLVNGGFETGDLTGWVSTGTDVPRVLRTSTPPQLPGSTHYLTRDWRIFNPQPFKLRQSVALPDGATDVDAVAMCYCADGGQIGTLRVFRQDDVAVPTGTNTFLGNVCFNFARSPEGEQLDLFVTSGDVSIFNGTDGVTGTRTFELRRSSDNSVYNRPVFLSISDLDSFEEVRYQDSQLLGWFLAPGSTLDVTLAAGVRSFTASTDNQTGGVILLNGAFEIHFVAISSRIGISGAPSPEWINQTIVEEVASRSGVWEELRLPIPASAGALTIVEIEGSGDPADVYFDNVRLVSKQPAQAPQVLAMARVEGATGGAELYLDGGLLRYVEDPAERGATVPVPAADISMADHAPGDVRVVSNGLQAWAWAEGSWGDPIEGPFSSVIADPVPMLVAADGTVISGNATELAVLGAGTWHASGDRRRDGGLMTDAPTGAVKAVANGGTLTTGTTQPASVAAAARRSLATDGGRIFGWSVGSTDLFWTSDVGASWKVAGALGAPIIKLVEMR